MTFKSTNDLAASDIFTREIYISQLNTSDKHSHDFKKIFVTRSNNRHDVPTFKNRATKIWNDLPGHMISLNSILSFKK